jgi:FKBP-type peptidyl-prolyl cis-trans isomerase
MKHILLMTGITVCLGLTLSCGPYGGKLKTSYEKTFDQEASYAIGIAIGTDFKTGNIYPDLNEFIKGLTDVLNGAEQRFDMQEANMILQQAFTTMNEERTAKQRETENVFLNENNQKPGILTTESGLQYEVITEGYGPKPEPFDTVRVHYEGSLTDGTVFDSSYNGDPAEIPLMQVIPGWSEGLQLMGVGSKYRLFIPSDIGYGSQGGGQIPPYSTLIFEVELLDIIRQD